MLKPGSVFLLGSVGADTQKLHKTVKCPSGLQCRCFAFCYACVKHGASDIVPDLLVLSDTSLIFCYPIFRYCFYLLTIPIDYIFTFC